MRQAINEYCARIGADPMLVQGAGGNVSWKDGAILWIKASGTWLADAAIKDIFVPVDLAHLNAALVRSDFAVTPRLVGASPLKPSIETVLHGLMPHRVVVHVHAIEALAHLVRADCESRIAALLPPTLCWTSVGYCKPGAALAEAVAAAIADRPQADIVLLKNHGVVIGGEDVPAVARILAELVLCLRTEPRQDRSSGEGAGDPITMGARQLIPVPEAGVQSLALDSDRYGLLARAWALYPDHVVFLGARPACFAGLSELSGGAAQFDDTDPLFVAGRGVYSVAPLPAAKLAQLVCYAAVIARQADAEGIRTLTDSEIGELLNWDAEKYRQHLSR